MTKPTITIRANLRHTSPAAGELFFGVLARTAVDGLGPVQLPAICREAALELVALDLASDKEGLIKS